MSIERNDPCSCGSGKKYKNCCQGKTRRAPGGILLLVAVIAVVGVGAVMMGRSSEDPKPAPRANIAVPGIGGASHTLANEAGSVPAAPVWSDEHFHWHTVNGAVEPTLDNPPPDHVWSEEHGHWHHAGGGGHLSEPPSADSEPPEGQVWSEEHGHYHVAPEASTPAPTTE